MIEVMQAHWTTVCVLLFTVLITPFYWFLVLPQDKARTVAWITAVVGAVLLTINIFNVIGHLSPFGGIIIALMWITAPSLVWIYRAYFENLDQRPIVGLQIFRLIGGFFLVEMFRGNIPGSFAWPAGVGDIIVGLLALFLCITYKQIPKKGLVALIIVGLADFASAFFFGFTSFEGPAQLFAEGFDNKANLFPTGIIPLFLVPYAITFHIISLINIKQYKFN